MTCAAKLEVYDTLRRKIISGLMGLLNGGTNHPVFINPTKRFETGFIRH